VGNNPIGRVDLGGLDDEDKDDPTSDENLAKGNNGAMQLKAKDCHEAAKNGLRVGKAVLEGGANACMMLCPVGGAAGGLRGARSAEVVAADVAKLKKVKECVKAKQEIKAALDATGKVHKALPKPKDFSKYHPEDLRKLMQDLKQSVQERIRVTARLGSNPGHDARQAEEQQLIKFIEKYLDDIKFPAN